MLSSRASSWAVPILPELFLQRAQNRINVSVTQQARGRYFPAGDHGRLSPSSHRASGCTQAHASRAAIVKLNHSQHLLRRLTEARSWAALRSRLRKALKAQCDWDCCNLHMGKCEQTEIPGTRSYWAVLWLLILTCEQDFTVQNWLQALSCYN